MPWEYGVSLLGRPVNVHRYCSDQVLGRVKVPLGETETTTAPLELLRATIASRLEKARYSLESDTKRDTSQSLSSDWSPGSYLLAFLLLIHCQLFLWKRKGKARFHFKSMTCDSALDQPMSGLWEELPRLKRTCAIFQTGRYSWSYRRASGRVKAWTATTFPRNLPAPFRVNTLWTEQKWQNQSITPEPTQRGIERLTEIDDIPAGILHWFGRPCDWNRQRFIVRARTLAALDCLDFFYGLLHIYP